MASRFSKWLIWLLLLAILSGVAGWFWWRRTQRAAAIDYQYTTVTAGTITESVTATGTLNPVLTVTVGSQISGMIQSLSADFNSQVKTGQVIARIDPGTYQAAVTEAEGELANARAAMELAAINASRIQRLLKITSASQSELDSANAALHQAQAQVKIKEGSLERARINLERCTIYSPIDGMVISRSVDVGQTVAASLSAPELFLIANDLTKMQIDANVAEADVGAVAAGQKVDFSVDAFPFRTFHGTVQQVRNAPLTVQNVVTYDTVIAVDNSDLKLKPGMTANVSILISERPNALRLPNAALRIRLDAPNNPRAAARAATTPATPPASKRPEVQVRPPQTVYVKVEGRKRPQPRIIQPGITDGSFTEVVSGLQEGDQVVTGMPPEGDAAGKKKRNPFAGNQRMGGR